MNEIIMYILIAFACFLGLFGIILQLQLQNKRKGEGEYFTKQLQFAVDQTTREMQKFFDVLKFKPTSQGNFGESIVEMFLANLPKDLVKKQYQPIDISGRIDFIVQLPESDVLLPIDSKFILPQEFSYNQELVLDNIAIDRLNKTVIRRGKEITKYASSVETTDFVLMFIPDFVYGVLSSNSLQELAQLKVVPTNTSGLLSTIFMINMQHRFVKLNCSAKKFGEIQVKTCTNLKIAIEKLHTGTIQMQNSLSNTTSTLNVLTKLMTTLETLELKDF